MVLLPAMRSQLPRADAAAAGAGSRASNIEGLFSSYKEPDEDKIGPEGIMQLCADMGIDASDVRLLILAWQLRASEQGYFSHAEWVEGLEGLRVDTTQALLERLDGVLELGFRETPHAAQQVAQAAQLLVEGRDDMFGAHLLRSVGMQDRTSRTDP